MDLGFVTHGIHMNSRMVYLQHALVFQGNDLFLQVIGPPDGGVYPPGPGFLFLITNGTPSEGVKIMVGNGASPPVDQTALEQWDHPRVEIGLECWPSTSIVCWGQPLLINMISRTIYKSKMFLSRGVKMSLKIAWFLWYNTFIELSYMSCNLIHVFVALDHTQWSDKIFIRCKTDTRNSKHVLECALPHPATNCTQACVNLSRRRPENKRHNSIPSHFDILEGAQNMDFAELSSLATGWMPVGRTGHTYRREWCEFG